jgi:hypothetical protein
VTPADQRVLQLGCGGFLVGLDHVYREQNAPAQPPSIVPDSEDKTRVDRFAILYRDTAAPPFLRPDEKQSWDPGLVENGILSFIYHANSHSSTRYYPNIGAATVESLTICPCAAQNCYLLLAMFYPPN